MNERDAARSAPSGPGAGSSRADAENLGASPPSGFDADQLVQDGLEHLQRAAREAIAAMRALLDLAEGLVEEPGAAEALIGTIGSFAQAARGGRQVNRARSAPTRPGAPDDDDDGGRVQRIPVS